MVGCRNRFVPLPPVVVGGVRVPFAVPGARLDAVAPALLTDRGTRFYSASSATGSAE